MKKLFLATAALALISGEALAAQRTRHVQTAQAVAPTTTNQPAWEIPGSCKKAQWISFRPKAEGDQPPCWTTREWKRCDNPGEKPLFANWCPAKAPVGRVPPGFQQ